ncbi:hypothetical protein YB2330_003148 [Saitoella coloradoensis]
MPFNQNNDNSVTLTHPSGSSAKVLLYGATVISWEVEGKERLFLSSKAKLDGTKAVRGGIPLVFPVFGKATEGPAAALPQHGFARTSTWELLGIKNDNDDVVAVQFGLGVENIDPEAQKQWPYKFGLIYTVELGKDTLTNTMEIRNDADAEDFDFQILFHSYLAVGDVSDVEVKGLEKVDYRDKTQGGKVLTQAAESEARLDITSEIDRLYVAPSETTTTVLEKGKAVVEVQRQNLKDVVVWNPWEKAPQNMGDFAPEDGWKRMICVEAGSVAEWHKLRKGDSWTGSQVLKALL